MLLDKALNVNAHLSAFVNNGSLVADLDSVEHHVTLVRPDLGVLDKDHSGSSSHLIVGVLDVLYQEFFEVWLVLVET